MKHDTQKSGSWLDTAAVALSALCLVHCLVLPLVIVGVPFLAQYADTHWHYQILVVVVPLSVLALTLGFRRHRDLRIVAAGGLGLLLLILGATVAHTHLGEFADRSLTIAGSLVLATAHFFNSYRRKLASSSF